MMNPPKHTRRDALKMLVGVPMLPLGTLATGAGLLGFAAEAGAAIPGAAAFLSATFTPMAALNLADAPAMGTTTVGSGLQVKYSDGTEQSNAKEFGQAKWGKHGF